MNVLRPHLPTPDSPGLRSITARPVSVAPGNLLAPLRRMILGRETIALTHTARPVQNLPPTPLVAPVLLPTEDTSVAENSVSLPLGPPKATEDPLSIPMQPQEPRSLTPLSSLTESTNPEVADTKPFTQTTSSSHAAATPAAIKRKRGRPPNAHSSAQSAPAGPSAKKRRRKKSALKSTMPLSSVDCDWPAEVQGPNDTRVS